MADERKIPGSALDVGENAVSTEAADIERDGINANEAPGESREEHSARIKREKQASFEYADNYRQKLKDDAANRRKTPAQLRKQAEKEAAIAREKEEREREIREAIEREKEEATNRAESAAALRDQVEKSLAEKKALEEAEREALEAAAEEPVEEPISEDLAEEPAEEPVDEAPEEEPVDEEEYEEEDLDEEDYLDEDEDEYYEEEDEEPLDMELFIDPDNLDGEPVEEPFEDSEEEDDLVTIKYGDEDEEPAEEALDDDDNMVLTFGPEDVVFVTPDEPEEAPVVAPAPVVKQPTEAHVEEPAEKEPTKEPVRKPKAAKKPEAAAPKKTKKRRRPKKAKKAPKKAVATPKKPVAKKAPVDTLVAPIVPVVESEKGILDDEIARLLEENKELLRENIEELRRRQAELERRQAALEDAARASAEEAEAPESPEEAIAEPAVEDELLAAPESPVETEELVAEPEAVPEEKVEAPRVISEDHENKKVYNRGVRSGVVEEIPDSEMIINYMNGEEAGYVAPVTDGITYIGTAGDETPSVVAPLATAAVAATGLALLSPELLKKKVKDNDGIVSDLKKKLAEADKQYRLAKDKDEKLERLAECAEYQRSILDFDAESLEATKALGKNTDKRKSALQKDISKYNAYAQKLEKRSMTQVPQAPASLADDILAGRPYTKLPPIIQKDDNQDEAKDVKAPMSYISQIDNDPNTIIGGAQPVAKRKLDKGEVKRSARELKQKVRENNRLLKENRKDLTEQLERAKAAEHNQKTEHLVSALNYQREIVATLGDSYEAAARTGDLAEARKISRQIDREVNNYNKLAKSVENRTGETLPRAYNTYAKDIADNRQSKLPPVVKYGAASNVGSFTDSEDVLVIRRVDPVEQLGTEKILKVGEEARTANQTQPAVYTDNLGAIMVTPPAGNEGQVIVVGDPKTVPVETVKALASKAYQIKEESRETPAAAVAPTIVYVQPAPATEPIATAQGTETVRPLASRIVESEEGRKVIPGVVIEEGADWIPQLAVASEETPESLNNMVEKAEEPAEALASEAAIEAVTFDAEEEAVAEASPAEEATEAEGPEYASLTAIGAEKKVASTDVKIGDTSKVIPIIINPDDNPVTAYVVTDSEILKDRFAAGKGESAIPEGTIVVGSDAEEKAEEASAPAIPVAVAPVEDAPVEAAPTEEAPVEEPAPVEETPAKEVPVAVAPVEEVAEEAIVKSRIAEEIEEESVAAPEEPVIVLSNAPVEAAPAEEAPVEKPAPEAAPVVEPGEVSVEGEYGEAKLESIDVEAPAETAPVEETQVAAAPVEETLADAILVEEATAEEPSGTAVDLEKVIVKTAQPGYIVTEERPAPVAEEPEVKTEEVVAAETDTYILKEHIPVEEEPIEVEEAITPEAHMPAKEQVEAARIEEAPATEAPHTEEAPTTEEIVSGEIKEYPPMEATEEETGDVTVVEDEVSREPAVFVIYGKKKPEEKPEAKAEAPEVVETRVLKAPKSKGKYTLTEGERAARAEEAPAEDEILHVGEEIVTVVEDEPVAEAPVADVAEEKKIEGKVIMAPKAKGRYALVEAEREIEAEEPEKTEAAPAEDEILHVGEEIATVVEDQPVAEETAPVIEEKKVYTGYVLTENSNEIKIISGKEKGRGYTLTEDPDVAKRIEAASNAEIEKGKYSIVVSNEQAKTIEGKAGVKYTITEREDGKKVITFATLPKAPRPEAKVEDEIVHVGEEVVTVVEEAIPEVYSELTAISDAPVEQAKADSKVTLGNTIVVSEVHAKPVVSEDKGAAKIILGKKTEETKAPETPDYTLVVHDGVHEEKPKSAVIESTNDIKVINAPKSHDTYVITEKVDSAKVITGKEEAPARKVEAHDDRIKVISGKEEKKANRVVTEIPEDTRVIAKAPVEHTVAVLPEDTKVIAEAPKAEEKKNILEENKVRNTAKGQNAYAILEKRDSAKVITAPEKEEPVAAVETPKAEPVAEQPVAVEAPKAEPVAVPKVEEKKDSTLIIPAGTKVLTTPKAKEKYLIIESRGPVKTITAPEVAAEEAPVAVKELIETEKVATISANKPMATSAKASIFKVRKSRGELKRLTKPGKPGVYVELDSERIITKREEETPVENALIYLNEREGGIRPAAEIARTDANKLSKYELRKTKGELKRLTKENKPGVYVELDSERIIPKREEETPVENAPIYLNEREGGIRPAADITDPNKVSKYVIRRTRGELKRLTKENKPGVYVELNSEKVIRPDDFKMPEEALVYVNVNERIKTVQAEEGVKEKLKEKIDIYKGSEKYIHGTIPVVDILIDPYKNLNMGILSEKDLKKHLAESQKEINHLRHDLKQAEKNDKAESDTDRLLALISKINTQCLICETYVTRINVCNNCDAFDEAKENADILSKELKVYNDYITEYNKITSMKVPLADKALPKRVLDGEAFEHLTRISHNLIEEEGLKTKKKSKIKLIEDLRYKADINLLNRRDAETKNSVSVVENRYIFETALLKGEKDILEFKFAKNSTRANSRKAYIARKLHALKGAKERAVRYEVEDNNRYYRVLTCDTNLESYKNNNAKKTKVTKIVSNVSQLLRERDEINSKLNAIYSGPLGDIVGATESEKWRDVKVTAAKSHAKKLRDKANALKNSVPGFGEEKAERIYAFNSLLDAKVEALATIDLCNYRLTKEKNSLAEIASIRKDRANAQKQIRLIDAEIRERKNIIKDEYYGPDGSADIIALVAIVLLGIVGLILVAGFFGLDLIGFIKPLLEKLADMIKGFLN